MTLWILKYLFSKFCIQFISFPLFFPLFYLPCTTSTTFSYDLGGSSNASGPDFSATCAQEVLSPSKQNNLISLEIGINSTVHHHKRRTYRMPLFPKFRHNLIHSIRLLPMYFQGPFNQICNSPQPRRVTPYFPSVLTMRKQFLYATL
jgi:hypothetical protein